MNIPQKINLSTIYFTLLCIICGFTNTPFAFPNNVLRGIILILFLLFVYCFYSARYSKYQIYIILILFTVTAITLYTSRNTTLLIDVMSIFVISNDNFKRVLKLIFTERLVIDLFINFCSIFGFIQNKITVAKDGELITGYGLGYNNPNSLACVVGMLILLYICIREDRLSLKDIVGIGIIILVTFYLTKTRSISYTLIPMFIFLIYLKYFRDIKTLTIIYNFVATYSYIIGALVGIGIPYLMSRGANSVQGFLPTLNTIASQRFFYAALAMAQYPLKLFGGNVYFNGLTSYNYTVVDDGYVRLIYAYGIIGLALFIIFSVLTIRKLIVEDKPYWILPFIVFAIWGVVETIQYSVNFNFAILFWGVLLQSSKSINEKKNSIENINSNVFKC